jgi:hypothetical protein
MPVGGKQIDAGDMYAKRQINVYKTSEGTRAATETKGQRRAQESAQAG